MLDPITILNEKINTEVNTLGNAVEVLTAFVNAITNLSLSRIDLTKIKNKTDEITTHLTKAQLIGNLCTLNKNQRLVLVLSNKIYEFTAIRIGILILDKNSLSVILDSLSLFELSRIMRTSKLFHRTIATIFPKKYEVIKPTLQNRLDSRHEREKKEFLYSIEYTRY